ncbi:MAG TPA: hypothetical protein VHD83_12885 [Puia sp.]|nr:hypothetical protein [Puia sp.]
MHKTAPILRPAITTIILAWLVAGTLDISYAIITWGPVFGKITAAQLLQGIASTLMGKDAFTGGISTALVGLAMHYGISLAWTLFYFFIFPYIPLLARNTFFSGILYGVFVWAMMGLLIVPLVTGKAWSFNLVPFLKSIAPMILLFGPAIAIIVGKHYARVTAPHPG